MKKIEFKAVMSAYRKERREITTAKGASFYWEELSRLGDKYKEDLGFWPQWCLPLDRPAIVSWKFASVLMQGKIGSEDWLFVKPKFN